MKFYRETNNMGQFSYRVERHDYDAFPPILELTCDHAPININRDREAVALTLLFSRWVSGEFDFIQKIGPNTISEIRRYCEPLNMGVGPVEYHPKALPNGRGIGNIETVPVRGMQRGVIDLPSDKFNGSIRSHDVIQLATNSFMLKQSTYDPIPALAIAVLFAEDLAIDTLVLPISVAEETYAKCRILLSSVRLGLQLPGSG